MLAGHQIPSFVAFGRQVVANGPQVTPQQEAARRRMMATARNPTRKSEESPPKSGLAFLRHCGT
jgi:hypothetical protein